MFRRLCPCIRRRAADREERKKLKKNKKAQAYDVSDTINSGGETTTIDELLPTTNLDSGDVNVADDSLAPTTSPSGDSNAAELQPPTSFCNGVNTAADEPSHPTVFEGSDSTSTNELLTPTVLHSDDIITAELQPPTTLDCGNKAANDEPPHPTILDVRDATSTSEPLPPSNPGSCDTNIDVLHSDDIITAELQPPTTLGSGNKAANDEPPHPTILDSLDVTSTSELLPPSNPGSCDTNIDVLHSDDIITAELQPPTTLGSGNKAANDEPPHPTILDALDATSTPDLILPTALGTGNTIPAESLPPTTSGKFYNAANNEVLNPTIFQDGVTTAESSSLLHAADVAPSALQGAILTGPPPKQAFPKISKKKSPSDQLVYLEGPPPFPAFANKM
ncbi:mucin-2-like [Schistocerca americana]|uniref:mucin-2-like n=1 Tax=Schistocerca americana TaxID=7009 RepID=UPI001F4FF411|nr:mucin-2-like [Schistocerca americana]